MHHVIEVIHHTQVLPRLHGTRFYMEPVLTVIIHCGIKVHIICSVASDCQLAWERVSNDSACRAKPACNSLSHGV